MNVDVVIVGSGPIGSAFARVLSEEAPRARILLVEAGPQLTATPGVHVKNIESDEERLEAQLRSQGPAARGADTPPDEPDGTGLVARLGTVFVDPERAVVDATDTRSLAAMSINVGGMAAHWTCACPHPYGRERIGFIPDREWGDLIEAGRRLLAVTTEAFRPSREGEAVMRMLSRLLDAELPEGRNVQCMPLACRIDAGGVRHWSGTDVVLGPLATDSPATFELLPETLCRRILTDGDRATGVLLEDSGRATSIGSLPAPSSPPATASARRSSSGRR